MDRGARVTPVAVNSSAEGPALPITIEYEVSREAMHDGPVLQSLISTSGEV